MAHPSNVRVCPKCSAEVRSGWVACPACATRLGGEADTKTIYKAASTASSAEEGRFPAGTVLAGRYRILGLVGQGGMGEVYRAYDLILNQSVALKFLGRANMSESALARFRNEVRIARQVSHPNVCRVYDIGFIEGFHFLSMEYLDGEDLASLIRRIGRLPQDKAIEFARKICAGLAAAHERGVLHRDLKPANIMIDGQGHVRITDFGLAALAQEIALADIRSGTPAYMSPEQKAGKEVTIRSDVYSLGLTLYEMFTGKRRTDTHTDPSEIVKDLDSAVERTILRCLEEDPRRRPSSALGVAMELPGGDPIAAALAAGETPSPEMVAASSEKEGLSPRTAVLCFVAFLALWAAHGVGIRFWERIPLPKLPPEALAFQAQGILKQLGYAEPPESSAYGFDCCDVASLRFAEKQGQRRDAILASDRPPVLPFWYRQHRSQLAPDPAVGAITFDSPANTQPGMIRLQLDEAGRLIALEVQPREADGGVSGSVVVDPAPLFTTMGLDLARFIQVPPSKFPPVFADTRVAWAGTYAADRTEPIRVEAAFLLGRPVFVDISGNWPRQPQASRFSPNLQAVLSLLYIAILAGGVLIARHNLRLGRGDRRGAWAVAVVSFIASLGQRLLQATYASGTQELFLLADQLALAGFGAALLWMGYIAVEPYVRRNWPDALISWNRLQAGRFCDPLVASHVLTGFLVLAAGDALIVGMNIFVSAPSVVRSVAWLNSTGEFMGQLFDSVNQGLRAGFLFLVLVVLLRLLIRKVWIADILAAVLTSLSGGVDYSNPLHAFLTLTSVSVPVYVNVWVLRRFGLLPWLVIWYANASAFSALPPTGAWYAGRVLVALAIPVTIAAWALWVILSAEQRPETEPAR